MRAEELKLEQVRLKQMINDRKTANILLDICGPPVKSTEAPESNGGAGAGATSVSPGPQVPVDKDIECILRRPNDEIPDGKKIMQETAAMVPCHKAKAIRSMNDPNAPVPDASGDGGENDGEDLAPARFSLDADTPNKASSSHLTLNGKFPDDGIDYALLSKDRNTCTPQELDRIRKERNRMHAKRTRDRKKIFVEEMLNMIKVLDDENLKLRAFIQQYYPENTFSMNTLLVGGPMPTQQFYAGSWKDTRKACSQGKPAQVRPNAISVSAATSSSQDTVVTAASAKPIATTTSSSAVVSSSASSPPSSHHDQNSGSASPSSLDDTEATNSEADKTSVKRSINGNGDDSGNDSGGGKHKGKGDNNANAKRRKTSVDETSSSGYSADKSDNCSRSSSSSDDGNGNATAAPCVHGGG